MGSSAGVADPNRPGAEMRCARGNKGWVQQQGGAAALLAERTDVRVAATSRSSVKASSWEPTGELSP